MILYISKYSSDELTPPIPPPPNVHDATAKSILMMRLNITPQAELIHLGLLPINPTPLMQQYHYRPKHTLPTKLSHHSPNSQPAK